ncbi:MAG: hypothetical protein ACE5HU_01125 [Acidobacteriota bacterium]
MTERYAKVRRILTVSAVAAGMVAFAGLGVQAQGMKGKMKMKMPAPVTLSGQVIDLTCSTKGHTLMHNWHNAMNDDHMTPDGKKASCATMCLKGGQPAALFDTKKSKITAVFACNPKATLSNYAAKEVDVMGIWTAKGGDGLATFMPQKIRAAGSTNWVKVDCATMHG